MIRNTACTNLCCDCFFFLKTSERVDKIEIISMKSQKTRKRLESVLFEFINRIVLTFNMQE